MVSLGVEEGPSADRVRRQSVRGQSVSSRPFQVAQPLRPADDGQTKDPRNGWRGSRLGRLHPDVSVRLLKWDCPVSRSLYLTQLDRNLTTVREVQDVLARGANGGKL